MKQIYTSIRILFVVLLLLGFSIQQPNRLGVGPENYTFGVKLGVAPSGELTQYAIIQYRNSKRVSIQPTDLRRLVKIATGRWPLPKTNIFHDYFEQYEMYNDSMPDGTPIDYGAAFDSLWKVRFSHHPFDQNSEDGWSQGDMRPSLKQQKFIYDRYGVRGYDQDYFADSSFFKLLKDVMNPAWIRAYKSLH